MTVAGIDALAARAIGLPTLPATARTGDAGEARGPGFADSMSRAVASLQEQHSKADLLAEAGVTGQLTDVHDYTIAATQAQLATDLTVAVRNRALEAFTSIMTMPV